MDILQLAYQQKPLFVSIARVLNAVKKTYQGCWLIKTDGERDSCESFLSAFSDVDDDVDEK